MVKNTQGKCRQLAGLFLVALLTTSLHAQVASEITASVNRNHIDRTGDLVLTLQVSGDAGARRPNFSILDQDWRTLTINQQSQINWINGTMRSTTSWRLTLVPKREGSLKIPPFAWKNSLSKAIAIRVSPISESLQQRLSKVAFFRTNITQGAIWVQSQIIYHVSLYYTQEVQFRGNPLKAPELPNTIIQALAATNTDSELINGVRYWVLRQGYAIFPQTSGPLVIPPEHGFGYAYLSQNKNNRKRIEIQSSGHRLEVLPKPINYPTDEPWLPASNVQLSSQWQGLSTPFYPDDVATLALQMQVHGLPASSLPNLQTPSMQGGRIYSHPSQSEESLSPQGISSRINSTLAVIPTQAGLLSLPQVSITWWDTQNGQVRQAVLDITNLSVSANPDALAVEETAQQPTQAVGGWQWSSNSWAWSTLALAAIWALTLIYALRLRLQNGQVVQIQPEQIPHRKGWQMLAAACRKKDASAIRQALDIWANEQRPGNIGSALAQLTQQDEEGRRLIDALERSLYQDSHVAFNSQAIFNWAERKRSEKQQKTASPLLTTLYPAT